MVEAKRDVVVNGWGSAIGGSYSRAWFEGVTRVQGDVDCEIFRVNGMSTINGRVKAQTIDVNGIVRQTGNLEGKTIRLYGKARINGSVRGERVEAHGTVSVNGDCEAEGLTMRGKLVVGGMINADTLNLCLIGCSKAKEIGGERICVRQDSRWWGGLLSLVWPRLGVCLTVDVVEGDDVYLEYTKARVVRGNTVTIGPNCVIDLVEAKQPVQRDPSARIKRCTQI